MDRTDDYKLLKTKLKEKCHILNMSCNADLPKNFIYNLNEHSKNLTITILEKGLKSNMQDNSAAFESWIMVLKFYLSDYIDCVTINWDDIDEKRDSLHFNRFVYRITKFIGTYNWVKTSKPIPAIPTNLVCNYPNIKQAANSEEYERFSEGWIENKYVEYHNNFYDFINRQLPVGIFKDSVNDKSHYTPGQNSAIDIWAIKNNDLYIFELKKDDNKPLGIISELMFYINIMHDIINHKIQFPKDKDFQICINENRRGFRDFYKAISDEKIQRIKAIFLANSFHALITPELIEFINESEALKSSHIYYSIENLNIDLRP